MLIRTTFACLIIFGCALSATPKPKNVLLLCVDDLRPELNSFGVDYIYSPNIDKLAEAGRAFHRHYVNAPSCGPSRYTLLTGIYGQAGNNALFNRAKALKYKEMPPSMPEWFREHGYTTVSVGKVSHHPGGLGGKFWNDAEIVEMPGAWNQSIMPTGEWEHPKGAMHGLAHGEQRKKGMMVLQSAAGSDTIYPDGLIAEAGVEKIKELAAEDEPFFLAIGLIRPHLPFGAPARYMEPYHGIDLPPISHPEKPKGRTTWFGSGEFMGAYSHNGRDAREDAEYADEVRRHYAACVTYVDKHVGDFMDALRISGKARDTIIVLWGDHGWHLGEHAIWGKHCLFEEALRAPLIIASADMERRGEKTDAIVESLDIFPTLCELTDLPVPEFAQGASLLPQLENPTVSGRPAYAYHGKKHTIRSEEYRLVLHEDGYVELYDHNSAASETVNVADQKPGVVEELKAVVIERSERRRSVLP